MDDIVEDEEVDAEVGEAEAVPATVPATAAPGDPEVGSIQDILVKQEARAEEEDEDEDDTVLSLSREERLEPLAAKVIPAQPTEFICQNCFLVKHRSQLKDKAKMLCRDCA